MLIWHRLLIVRSPTVHPITVGGAAGADRIVSQKQTASIDFRVEGAIIRRLSLDVAAFFCGDVGSSR